MPHYEFDGRRPCVDQTAFVHESAVLIGDVTIGPNCYIGPCASLRGDFGRIEIGAGSNVQDNCTLHVGPGEVCILETDSHVGHGAIVHGAHICRNAMIGMNAVVMDGAVIGSSSIISACAFVKSGQTVPPGVLVVGIPGRVVRHLSASEIEAKSQGTKLYQTLAERSLATLKLVPVTPPCHGDPG